MYDNKILELQNFIKNIIKTLQKFKKINDNAFTIYSNYML